MNIPVTVPATIKIGATPEGAMLILGEADKRWWQFWRKSPTVALLTEKDLIWVYQVVVKIMKQRATKETPLTQMEEFKNDIERAMNTIGQERTEPLVNGDVAAKRLAELLSGKGYVKL